jgi:hypothetical protein
MVIEIDLHIVIEKLFSLFKLTKWFKFQNFLMEEGKLILQVYNWFWHVWIF